MASQNAQVAFQTIIAQTNAAMSAEKNGHIMGQWAYEVCTCIKCNAYIQMMPQGNQGTALSTKCSGR